MSAPRAPACRSFAAVRGQYRGYRQEEDVAADSDVGTFYALSLFIDSWRWAGVPWYLRAGNYLPMTSAGVIIGPTAPPQRLFDDSPTDASGANYIRITLQAGSAVAQAGRIERPGNGFVGKQRELYPCEDFGDGEQTYERLLGDAMAGDRSLFTSRDAVDAAWSVVDLVFFDHPRCLPYAPGSWSPAAADALIAGGGGWHNPAPDARPPTRGRA